VDGFYQYFSNGNSGSGSAPTATTTPASSDPLSPANFSGSTTIQFKEIQLLNSLASGVYGEVWCAQFRGSKGNKFDIDNYLIIRSCR
jgi:hypothetical protein